MQSEGPRQGEGGGDDVEGLLKSVGAGGGTEQREGGTGEKNRKGRRGQRLWAAAAAVWVSLHSWQAECRLPRLSARPPVKVGYGGKELSSDTGKGASSHR